MAVESNRAIMIIISVIGLGYVGLELAVSLSKHYSVIGYDISESRVNELHEGFDRNQLVSVERLTSSQIQYTTNLAEIKKANFYIVTVSTPSYFYELPNLEPLVNATKDLASMLKKGDTIVYESTVYPGTTEDTCIPILEQISQLKSGIDFSVGYSPERINPNDKVHTLQNITKVISAQNSQTLKLVQEVYGTVCDKVYPVSNIKTAEAVKVLENTQRDVNIALMNEFAEIAHALDLNTHEILKAAQTKWSFVPFKPGFVGGHCISIDPHYLAFKAKRLGLKPDLILTARKINDNMPHVIVNELIKIFIKRDFNIKQARVGIFGITYKENTPDIRNSLALKLLKELKNYDLNYEVHDPFANKKILQTKYNIELKEFADIKDLTVTLILVPHDFYREQGINAFIDKFNGKGIIMDIPNLFAENVIEGEGIIYWNL